MDFRIDVIVLILLLATELVLCASAKESGRSRLFKKKGEANLGANIGENPFLQHSNTTVAQVALYRGNPFLSNGASLLSHENDSTEHQNDEAQHENQVEDVAVYTHNPFLYPGSNGPVHKPNTISTNISRNTNNPGSNIVNQPPISGRPLITPNFGLTTRTTSEIKCEEYARQVAQTTEILPLVGTNPEVSEVSFENCRTVNHLVIGGTMASIGEYPHMVALGRGTNGEFGFQCGGTLIAPEWVLTAAHCIYGPSGGLTTVRLGLNDLSNNQSGQSITIKSIIRHPSFRPPAMYADIALIKLELAVAFNNNVRPACLYQSYDTAPSQAWVSGWGVTEFGGDQSDKLQKALLDIIDNFACTIRHNRSIAVPYGVSPSMICAGDTRGGWAKDTCQGDSGGPLQVIHPDNGCLYEIIGITSFGQGCAMIETPGVYTRVSHYLSWIEEIVWPGA